MLLKLMKYTMEAAQKLSLSRLYNLFLGFQIIDQNNNTYIFCKYTLIYESRPHGKEVESVARKAAEALYGSDIEGFRIELFFHFQTNKIEKPGTLKQLSY